MTAHHRGDASPHPTRRLLSQGLAAGLSAWALLLAGCASGPATPPPPPPEAPEVRAALAPTGTLRVAVYPGSPTSLVRVAPTDEMRGLTVDLGRELARRLGVPVEFVQFERVPQIVDAIKAGRADFTITNASPARALDVDFAPTVVSLESGYLVRAGSPLQAAAEVDRAGVRVGVAQGSTSQGVLTRDLKAAQLLPQASVVVATEQLRAGALDAFATNKAILFEMADQLPGARVLPGRWGLEHLAMAVPKGRGAGAAWLAQFNAQARADGTVTRAAQRAGLRGLATD